MAKYRLRCTRQLRAKTDPIERLYLVEPHMKEAEYPIVDLDDDFPAGHDMEPLDAAAKKQVAAYDLMMKEKGRRINPTDSLEQLIHKIANPHHVGTM